MKCNRCEQYPCRCTGGVDVVAEYHTRGTQRRRWIRNEHEGMYLGFVLGIMATILTLGLLGYLP